MLGQSDKRHVTHRYQRVARQSKEQRKYEENSKIILEDAGRKWATGVSGSIYPKSTKCTRKYRIE